MSAVQEVIDQLECSLQSSSSPERLQILRSVTDLYLNGVATHSEENIELFDQALNLLIDYVETQALVRLSSQLASIATVRTRRRRADTSRTIPRTPRGSPSSGSTMASSAATSSD